MSTEQDARTRPVVSFDFSTHGLPEFVAMWHFLHNLCELHGFPDELLEIEADMAFRGVGKEQLDALLAACEGFDLSPHVRYEEV